MWLEDRVSNQRKIGERDKLKGDQGGVVCSNLGMRLERWGGLENGRGVGLGCLGVPSKGHTGRILGR